jgi:hypothetical protein
LCSFRSFSASEMMQQQFFTRSSDPTSVGLTFEESVAKIKII